MSCTILTSLAEYLTVQHQTHTLTIQYDTLTMTQALHSFCLGETVGKDKD